MGGGVDFPFLGRCQDHELLVNLAKKTNQVHINDIPVDFSQTCGNYLKLEWEPLTHSSEN